jgi:hypothetical protein
MPSSTCQRLEGAWLYFVFLIDHSAGPLLGTCRLFQLTLPYIVIYYCFCYRIDFGFGQNAYLRWLKASRVSSRRERVHSEGARLVQRFVLGSRFRGIARSEQGANGPGVLSIDI